MRYRAHIASLTCASALLLPATLAHAQTEDSQTRRSGAARAALEYVQDGIADLGIVGENVIAETGADVTYLHRLGFGKCTLKIAVPSLLNGAWRFSSGSH